jgi:putative tricarboxylic transport membrane protein
MRRIPQDAAAGLFLIGIAGIALWQIADLPVGTVRQFGPGMLPRALAVIVGALGLVLFVRALRGGAAPAERIALRGPLFVIGATVAFAASVRVLGLSVAGPLVVLIGALASPEIRIREAVIHALALSAACIVLFKYGLTLPIPVAPWLIGY